MYVRSQVATSDFTFFDRLCLEPELNQYMILSVPKVVKGQSFLPYFKHCWQLLVSVKERLIECQVNPKNSFVMA